ncbi:ciliary microtubule inner protein 2C isoform X4 [Macaca fascicularis]|uniref:ciliary microtubule inner protein 2C isoform X4 n=1 Tax=Macaca fascicularis TaxID=9541 RepID=UPI003D15C5BE
MQEKAGPSAPGTGPAPSVRARYQGHVPTVAFSFGAPYGTTTLKYFQDHRNTAMEKSHTPFSQGGHFPTIFSTNPNLLLMERASTRDRWLHKPSYTRFNLDSHRSTELTNFYQASSVPEEEVAPFESSPREPEDLPDLSVREEGLPARAEEERLLL